jgi:hypothetical protein
MSIFRSYIEKNNTIIRDRYFNTGLNPVAELVYGGAASTGSTVYSRYIFKLDLDDLNNRISENIIISGSVLSHKMKFYNTISQQPDIITNKMADGSKRASGFDLVLFKLSEEFDEGNGYNFNYNTYSGVTSNITASNWFYRKENVLWNEEGIYTGNTIPLSAVVDTFHVDYGDENIEFDVTDYINGLLFSGNTNYGLGIAYSADTEIKTDANDQRYSFAFFSRHTNTFFEPFLETEFNDLIKDDRYNFYLNKNNKLYLYSYINGELTDLDTIPSGCTITDFNGDVYTTIPQSGITHVTKGVYSVELFINANDYPDLVNFTDTWVGLVYDSQNISNVENEFTLLHQENYFNLKNQNQQRYEDTDFYFGFHGLKHGENIKKGDIRKIYIESKELYGDSVSENKPINSVQYRLYVRQGNNQIEVIPFTDVNRTFDKNYFDLDTTWLIPNTYFLELKIKKNNFVKTFEAIKFKVGSELKF